MTGNPYIIGPLVQNPQMFFGRKQELGHLRSRLGKGGSTAVVGVRRIGKSSLLYQLAQQTEALPEGVVVAYLDLHDPACRTLPGLLSAALRGLDERLHGRYGFGPVAEQGVFGEAVRQMRQDGFRPVLCLDEVEKLMERPEFDRDFFEGLRALGNMGSLVFVTASHATLADVVRPGGKTSPFYNIFEQIDLAGLRDAPARALLVEPFRRAGRPTPPPAYVELALEQAGHHPLFLQIAGSLLWEGEGTNQDRFQAAFAERARGPLGQIWRNLSADEQAAAIRMAGGAATVRDRTAAETALLRAGLAEKDDRADVNLFSPLLGEMIRSGELERTRAARPVGQAGTGRPLARAKVVETPPLYAFALVGLVALLVAAVIAQWLSFGFVGFFIIFVTVLLFTLVGVDKLTGMEFLEWLRGVLGRVE